MLKKLVTSIVGTRFERELKRIRPIVERIHEHERRLKDLPDAEIQAQTPKLKGLLQARGGDGAARLAQQREAKRRCADQGERERLEQEILDNERALKRETDAGLDAARPEAFAM